MKYLLTYFTMAFIGFLLMACTANSSHQHLYTVHKQNYHRTLFFTGAIQPLRTTVITAPAEGTVVETAFQYGDIVKKNQLIFKIDSAKFLNDYKTAFMQYIKNKNDFDNSKTELTEAEFLHRHLLISDNDYKAKQSVYYAAELTWLQAKDNLQVFLNRLNIQNNQLLSLDITSVSKIDHTLHVDTQAENLQIVAPVTGAMLAPSKDESANKKIRQGDSVKEGDVLALIGDMTGLSVEINVNEITVNQLTLGQPIHLTGPGFPGMTLTGTITRIDHQADIQNGNMPTFPVTVTVPQLMPTEQAIIHVGMSANVEIINDEKSEIRVPMNALIEKNNRYYLRLYDTTKKSIKDILVTTGRTTPTEIAILSGLQDGDRIIVAD